MEKIDLEELERLAAQATHLPWKVSDIDDRYIVDGSGKRELARVSMRYKPYPERAEYIAAACNAVPELIARVRELEAELETYKKPIDFPKLREGVAHVDNSLSDFLEDSIKRAAARP